MPNDLYGRKRKETHVGFYPFFELKKVGDEIVVSYMWFFWTDGRDPLFDERALVPKTD